MRLAATALALILAAAPLAAADLPALHDVTGVAADDVLNVRDNPRATATRIGELPPDGTGVEVVALSESGDWGRINIGERSGWVRMTYLRAQGGAGATVFDAPLACFGTEPFWSATFRPGEPVAIETPDGAAAALTLGQTVTSAGSTLSAAALAEDTGGGAWTVVVRRAACTDGMSDRHYGLTADLVGPRDGVPGLLTGCCSLAVGN